MKIRIFSLGLLALFICTLSAQAKDLVIYKAIQPSSNNGKWIIKTNQGNATLKNIFRDGSTWQLKINKKTYKINRTFSTPDEWKIADAKAKGGYINDKGYWIDNSAVATYIKTASNGKYNSWYTLINEDKLLRTETVFSNDYSKWEMILNKNEKMSFTSPFSNGKEWIVKDTIKGHETQKLIALFAVLISSTILK